MSGSFQRTLDHIPFVDEGISTDRSADPDRDSARATSGSRAEARRQALAVARSAKAAEDQEFVEAISAWDDT